MYHGGKFMVLLFFWVRFGIVETELRLFKNFVLVFWEIWSDIPEILIVGAINSMEWMGGTVETYFFRVTPHNLFPQVSIASLPLTAIL